MSDIIFWSSAGFISSYLISNIFIQRNEYSETQIFNSFTTMCLICGFIRGYTGKSICEILSN